MYNNVDTRLLSRGFLAGFIDIYRENTALWKIKSKGYQNRMLKQRGYEALVNYCKPVFPEADRDFVTKKIQNMRGAFRKELKKVEDSKRSGDGSLIYEPRLWYFNSLLFTKDQEIPNKNFESVDLENDDEYLNELEDDLEEIEPVEEKIFVDHLQEEENDTEIETKPVRFAIFLYKYNICIRILNFHKSIF